jgi:uncharacterized membrane protein YsdA (DUF1294 family)
MIYFITLFYVSIITLILTEKLHAFLLFYYLILGLLTYFIYKKDKKASHRSTWRVSEKTLHILSLLGGWTGAYLAQQTLRHKTQKRSFKVIFMLTIALNLIFLLVFIFILEPAIEYKNTKHVKLDFNLSKFDNHA